MPIILTRTKAERNSAGQSKEYIALPGTYSDHMTLEDETKKALFSGIEEAINQYRGQFTIYDTIDIAFARKP